MTDRSAERAGRPDDLGALMRTRRAVREYLDREVPEDLMREILEAGRWAPSPANRQPVRLVWVRDRAIKEQLQALAIESKELSAYWDPIFRPGGPSAFVNDLLRPEVVAVVADPAQSLTNVHADNGFEWAGAMAAYAMWLRAHSLGLGAIFVQHWITEKAKRILNVPLRWTFLGTLTVGYAATAPEKDRLPFDEVVHLDRFRGEPHP